VSAAGEPTPGPTVLLLVDLQEDFLNRSGLEPARATLAAQAAELVSGCRELGVPVLHVHTRVRADGADRMRHWQREDRWECLDGTPGALPPQALRPVAGEEVFAKRFFSAFEAPGLDAKLEALGAETLLVAGAYLHACVRATALDAYARGYRVRIAEDAVGSTEPVHAEITRAYLDGRAASFVTVEEALAALGRKREPLPARDTRLPVAYIDGRWAEASADARWLRHWRPARTAELVAAVPAAGAREVAAAAAAAARAQRASREQSLAERVAWLEAWAGALAAREAGLVDGIVREVGKPRAEAQAELRRARAHLATAARVARAEADGFETAPGVRVRHRPVGVVGLVTPWNNPVAIPVGKLAPALGFGNGVVWKPAHQAPHTARALLETLQAAGVPGGLVSLVFGEAQTARHLIGAREIGAVSVTGSIQTGKSAAALCAHHGKALQAELGGNNAAVVLADWDAAAAAPQLALAAFGFAGQRCTATRRFVVERPALAAFLEALLAAVHGLRVGDPDDPATQVGPLISRAQCGRVAAALELARAEGGRLLCGGGPPSGLEGGAWFAPTVVAGLEPGAHLVCEETFGPVAVVQVAEDLDDALRLANAVEQGLVASVHTRDAARRARFLEAAEAGMLNLAPGALAVHPEAPFVGWKASAIGPPEHGVWDREFYTRRQVVYGGAEDPRR
jgi:acyl-CoA reductase-like NAD-dependent aldehyde dehydrogenase/nicotinamidase-related amidase